MEWNMMFFVNSALLGVGLAMDAFSVSLANGLNEPRTTQHVYTRLTAADSFAKATSPTSCLLT